MQNAYHITATVLPGNRIELATPELSEGEQVDIFVIPSKQGPPKEPRKSALEIIEGLNGHRLFQSVEEVDKYINEERNSW